MKEQFIRELSESLKGQVSEAVYQDTISYYKSYIDGEINKGKTEKEVIELLGSGRLIAKSVIDANAGNREQNNQPYETASQTESNIPFSQKAKWIIILLLVLIAVLAVAGIIIKVLWLLLPVIIIAAVAVWVFNRI